jgi:hypothetical protein
MLLNEPVLVIEKVEVPTAVKECALYVIPFKVNVEVAPPVAIGATKAKAGVIG